MTGQTDSERYVNTARRQFTGGRAGNIALADGNFSEVPEPMESSSAWLGLNEGYRNGWQASLICRYISSICSQRAIRLLRVSYHGTGPAIWRRRGGRPVTTADFAAWRFEGGKVAEISTIQDQLAPL